MPRDICPIADDAGADARDDTFIVSVTRRPLAGKEADLGHYPKGITDPASVQPGHLGSTTLGPSRGGDRSQRILFRFDRRSTLGRWEQSDERARWPAVAARASRPREAQVESGLDAWFTVPNCDVPAYPPQIRQTLVVWLGIFLIVSLLSVVSMPRLSWWFASWLHRTARK